MEQRIDKAKDTKQNVWKAIKNAKRADSMIVPTLKDENNILYYTNKEKANAIAYSLQQTQQYDVHGEWTNQIQENLNNILDKQENEQENNIN